MPLGAEGPGLHWEGRREDGRWVGVRKIGPRDEGQELWVEGSHVGVLGRRGLGARVWCRVDLVG